MIDCLPSPSLLNWTINFKNDELCACFVQHRILSTWYSTWHILDASYLFVALHSLYFSILSGTKHQLLVRGIYSVKSHIVLLLLFLSLKMSEIFNWENFSN